MSQNDFNQPTDSLTSELPELTRQTSDHSLGTNYRLKRDPDASATSIRSSKARESRVTPSKQDVIYKTRDAIVTLMAVHQHQTHYGNGFLIAGHYIICPAQLILVRESETLTISQRILVTISNVNGSGEAYSYQVKVIGLDGVGNLAVLGLEMSLPWNQGNPTLTKDHPHLRWGKSRNTCAGDQIIAIGNFTPEMEANGVVIGQIVDNRYVCPDGRLVGELLLLNGFLSQPVAGQGFPILTMDGAVIGMFVATIQQLALSEYFMRRPVKAIIFGHINENKEKIPENYRYCLLVDPELNCFRYLKGCLGLHGTLMTQADYLTQDGQELTEQLAKRIIGYRLTQVPSQLEQFLAVGDLVTHLDECPLGGRKGQFSPSITMWRLKPGSQVTLTYRRRLDHYQEEQRLSLTVQAYQVDYPTHSCLI